jgi:hypothetical protein
LIISKSSSYERRNAIRRTYGNLNNVFKYIEDTSTRLHVRLLFMINIDENRMKSIHFEQMVYNDMVQVTGKTSVSFHFYFFYFLGKST